MSRPLILHPDRLLPGDHSVRELSREILSSIQGLPIISPHGHVPIEWFDKDFRFGDATDLLIRPDHYLLRMLASQGFRYEELGVGGVGSIDIATSREAFRTFARNYHLFLGTPSKAWFDHALSQVLGITQHLESSTADAIFDQVTHALTQSDFTPRSLVRKFGVTHLATTDSAVADLARHLKLRNDISWTCNLIPTFRPDSVTDPEHVDFSKDMQTLADLTGLNVSHWALYLEALQMRREEFKSAGATATDHGFETPDTTNLAKTECQTLLDLALDGTISAAQAATFRARMLMEMARMSAEDGMVMQIHSGSRRNYSPTILGQFGLDKGFDIPRRIDWAKGLKPLLDELGFHPNLRIILYTLDETGYGRELAPLAGAFPVLRLGAPWWFFDSNNGMARQFEAVVETAGFFNFAGFVDDTRALLSIPARHDVYRRSVASFLARLVTEHQIRIEDAHYLAKSLTTGLIQDSYRLGVR